MNPDAAYAIREAYSYRLPVTRHYVAPDGNHEAHCVMPLRGPFARTRRAEIAADRAWQRVADAEQRGYVDSVDNADESPYEAIIGQRQRDRSGPS